MDGATNRIGAVLRAIDDNLPQAQARLFDVLRIPSVSAQPAHAGDCLRAAAWFRDQLAGLGFAAEIVPTKGQPLVLARHPGPDGYAGPHVLFYGHYDVQPAEPLDLWTSPPFEPALAGGPRGERVVARGAVDDKGQVMMFVEALRAWHETGGGIPARVTVLMEGEEEVGSVNFEPWLAEAGGALNADVALVSDTGMWDIDTPAITTGLRGMIYVQMTVRGPARDLHSGIYGGAALNPINALTRALGDLHDETGRIRIPGFYDDVCELSADQAADWDRLSFDEGAFLGAVGLSSPAGERERPALQRLWSRPTADINGIWGGYTEAGAKTVIPSEASAKLSLRLVPDQNPDRIAAAARRFVEARLPPDARLSWEVFSATPAIAVRADSPYVAAARTALAEEYGRPALLMGSGGSIPVVSSFRRILDVDTVLMGFGLADDQMHGPNEKFELTCFRRGARSHARLLAKFAGLPRRPLQAAA
ncbi:MAG: M20/M25/M40 family metallo-hydrolase [Acetobacteraceae bacterium]|nr:M20/M25/M40 family metallo-hydrolase [Acetobacteraceae bacterium]